jgi:hypothetical protein
VVQDSDSEQSLMTAALLFSTDLSAVDNNNNNTDNNVLASVSDNNNNDMDVDSATRSRRSMQLQADSISDG